MVTKHQEKLQKTIRHIFHILSFNYHDGVFLLCCRGRKKLPRAWFVGSYLFLDTLMYVGKIQIFPTLSILKQLKITYQMFIFSEIDRRRDLKHWLQIVGEFDVVNVINSLIAWQGKSQGDEHRVKNIGQTIIEFAPKSVLHATCNT